MLGKAIAIVSESFKERKDKGGKPYVLHCLWVMNKVRHLGEKYMIAAVLHDLIEDTEWTILDLAKEGFSEEVCAAVDCLTHYPSYTYEQYIGLIAQNEIATQVKLRDLEHNSKITRLKGVTPKDLLRVKKYHNSYLRLSSL